MSADMDLDVSLRLAGDLRSPAEARRFVGRVLTPLLGREDVETAMLVTSELVTNAALHAGTECELVLRRLRKGVLQIRVSDFDPSSASGRRTLGDELSGGRGLRLLEVLCTRWGVDRDPQGKTVWCDLRIRE